MARHATLEAVVHAQCVVIRYGKFQAVSGVSLSVRRGEVVALVGPDGAGKTSFLRAVAGLQPLTTGTLRVLGLDPWRERHLLHLKLGYLAQVFALYGDLSVDENLAFIGQLMGLEHWRERRNLLLDRLGLAPFRQRRAQALSGGMKQKLALAASLMHDPELLVLDEPTTGVDPLSRREFWRLLADFLAKGLTLLLATPYLDEAQRAHRVLLCYQGGIVAEGDPRALARDLPYRLLLAEGEPRAALRNLLVSLPGVVDVQPFATGFHVFFEPSAPFPTPEAFAAAGVRLSRLEELPPSLEDVFLAKLTHG